MTMLFNPANDTVEGWYDTDGDGAPNSQESWLVTDCKLVVVP